MAKYFVKSVGTLTLVFSLCFIRRNNTKYLSIGFSQNEQVESVGVVRLPLLSLRRGAELLYPPTPIGDVWSISRASE